MTIRIFKGETEVATLTGEGFVFGRRLKESPRGMMETEMVDDPRCAKMLGADGKTAFVVILAKVYEAKPELSGAKG